ncbi:IS3 family transposase [Diaphorobacter aerolatus]|uniref:IS3 family transposase n=1 Tax=Diaphorobacter aerolatus TaxID=1288495 RepID=A0A7H0GFX3_9BURK|nr:IS3 family transposase [Diaphorobacter aerolatus]QNP47189.1 IS3 family transposase [Diaphorobacter aerolatus]
MESEIKRTQRDYTLAFKLAVVEQVEKGELTYRQAQSKYGIQGRSTVLVWLRKHGRLGWSVGASSAAMRIDKEPQPLTPEQRIKELEVQLKDSQQKAQLFEAVIDVLRKDYGVRVKKAFGQVLQEKLVQGLSVSRACQHMGMSRQAHYQGCQRHAARMNQAQTVVQLVEHERMRQPRVGTRKLQKMLEVPLQKAGIAMGRDALFDVLRNARMLVAPKRAYHKTTHSHHRFRRHPNLLKGGPQQEQATRSEQVWVADITYLPTQGKFVYLSLITDAYSRKIVGWHVHASLQTQEVAQAFKNALKARQSQQPLTHHSDRGIQYCADYYQELHKRHGVTCSMTDGYDCYQNALAERVNGILKGELLLQRPADLAQARRMVKESVQIYNCERLHTSLKMQTPDAVHRASMAELLRNVQPSKVST